MSNRVFLVIILFNRRCISHVPVQSTYYFWWLYNCSSCQWTIPHQIALLLILIFQPLKLSLYVTALWMPVCDAAFGVSLKGLCVQLVKNLPAMWETRVQSLGWDDPLEKGKATYSRFWPGEFHGLYSPQGHKELDTTEPLSLSFYLLKGRNVFMSLLQYFHIVWEWIFSYERPPFIQHDES